MDLDLDALVPLTESYLSRQRWYVSATADLSPGPLSLVGHEIVQEGQPGLVRLLMSRAGRVFQVLVGIRRPGIAPGSIRNEESALIGAINSGGDQCIVYDALFDDALALRLLTHVTRGVEHADRVRIVSSLASHASLVYDDRLFMKCYHILEVSPRPEVEAVLALDEVGFNALLAPVAHESAFGYDLALVREFLPSALEGRALALTSLRDLFAHASSQGRGSHRFETVTDARTASLAAGASGGDLSSEIRRLGSMTARLHLSLAEAFDTQALTVAAIARSSDLLGADLGRAIRVHGDYHLRRVMRSESGWVVAGFGDDPLYAGEPTDSSLAPRFGSPLEDVADMFFSLTEVAFSCLGQRPVGESSIALLFADAWVTRNKEAFLRGYLESPLIEALLPPVETARDALLSGYVTERQRRYEAAVAGV